jgi:glycosyltransferase involved in cell wall biosynthesis
MDFPRIGLLAYASKTGLGYQTLEFARHVQCEKILISDLSRLNGMPVDLSWYDSLCENVRVCDGIPQDDENDWVADGVDVLFVCETPLHWGMFEQARKKNVKIILQYNYEFLSYIKRFDLPFPNVLASPSYWMIDEVKKLNIAPVHYLPVPVCADDFKFRVFDQLDTIFHVTGRPAANDRNGTSLFLKMAESLGTRYKYKIYAQTPKEQATKEVWETVRKEIRRAKRTLGDCLEVVMDVADYRDLYSCGELMVLPRRYGGLCLPLWEALASGVPVIMPDISPNNRVLPSEWLVHAPQNGSIRTHSDIPMYEADVDGLCAAVERVEASLSAQNQKARELAIDMSWSKQRQNYLSLFSSVCEASFCTQKY